MRGEVMPLLDHFHDPLKTRLGWESLHSGWATYLASNLVEHWLPSNFLAVEHTHLGPRVEIDGATYEGARPGPVVSSNGGGVATLTRSWTVPAALCTVPVVFPDQFEVLVYASPAGWELVGAIEFISPG